MKLQEYALAIRDFDESLRIEPRNTYSLSQRAECKRALGQCNAALDDYNTLLGLEPNDIDALTARGMLLQDRGDHEGAVRDFDAVVRLDPRPVDALRDRAASLIVLGRGEQAVDDCNRAVEMAPEHATPYGTRAQIYAALGQYQKAADDLASMIELAHGKSRPLAFDKLAWLLATCPDAKLRDGERALVLVQQAISWDDNLPAGVLNTLAAVEAERGDFSEALHYETMALDLMIDADEKVEYSDRRALYQTGRPYRDDGKGKRPSWVLVSECAVPSSP